MKKHGILMVVVLLLASCSSTSKLSDEEKKVRLDELVQLVESGNFSFEAQSASPSGGQTIQLSSSYSLDRKDGEFNAYLPYFGRAYMATPGGSGGVEFKGEGEDLEVTRNDKKNMVELRFSIDSDEDRYELFLSVGISGFGNLTVTSQKRSTISYYGSFSELKEKSEEDPS